MNTPHPTPTATSQAAISGHKSAPPSTDGALGGWDAGDSSETLAKLKAFKYYVHDWLDAQNVPSCEGNDCRVALRLSLLSDRLKSAPPASASDEKFVPSQDRLTRLESWAIGVCECLESYERMRGPKINGAGLWLDLYKKLPPPAPAQPRPDGVERERFELPDAPGPWKRDGDMGIPAWEIIVHKHDVHDDLLWAGWEGDMRRTGHIDHLPRIGWHKADASRVGDATNGRTKAFFEHLRRRAHELCKDYPFKDSDDAFEWLWAITSSLEGSDLACGDLHTRITTLEADLAAANERAVKAEAFKAWVHAFLDRIGVPSDPDPEANAKHGCRISGRMQWLVAKGDAALEQVRELRGALEKIAKATQEWVDGVGSYAGGETNAGFACRLQNIARAELATPAPQPLAGQGESLLQLVLRVCKVRGWSLHWTHRSAYLHLEAAELAEAKRGKRGVVLDEAADVLVTMLALSGCELDDVAEAAMTKMQAMLTKPRYAGEETTIEPPRYSAGEQGGANG